MNYPENYDYFPEEINIPDTLWLASTRLSPQTGALQVTLQPGATFPLGFMTSNYEDMFQTQVAPGFWHAHVFAHASSSGAFVAGQPTRIDFINTDYDTELLFNDLSNYSVAPVPTTLTAGPSGAGVVLFNALDSAHGYQAYSPISVYRYNLIVFNTSSAPIDVTLYFGGEEYPSRFETNLVRVERPLPLSWVYGQWYYEGFIVSPTSNPAIGQMIVRDFGNNVVDTNLPLAFSSMYNHAFEVNSTTFAPANIHEYFTQLQEVPYFVNVRNAYDPKDYYSMFGATEYNSEYGYRGFRYAYCRTYGDDIDHPEESDPSVNRMIIYSIRGNNDSTLVNAPAFDYELGDTDHDFFQIYTGDGPANPDVVCYTVLYNDSNSPIPPENLRAYFRAFVDFVIYNGPVVSSVEGMQSNFNMNFDVLKKTLTPLYDYFEFIDFNNLTQDETSGSGAGFEVDLRGGRNYFPQDYHFDKSGNESIDEGGSGYQVGNTIRIYGTQMGGASPLNDALITVTQVDAGGAVTAYTVTGIAPYLQGQTDINDGGDDQYNGGNYLFTNTTSEISYGYGINQPNVYGPGSNTIIDYNDGIFVMFNTNCSGNSNFYVEGYMGADGYGFVDMQVDSSWYIYPILFAPLLSANGFLRPEHPYTFELQPWPYFGGASQVSLRAPDMIEKIKPSVRPNTMASKQRLMAQRKVNRDKFEQAHPSSDATPLSASAQQLAKKKQMAKKQSKTQKVTATVRKDVEPTLFNQQASVVPAACQAECKPIQVKPAQRSYRPSTPVVIPPVQLRPSVTLKAKEGKKKLI